MGPKLIYALFATLALTGCEDAPRCQRFVPVGNLSQAVPAATPDFIPDNPIPLTVALALDTKTGTLCLTYQYKVDVDYPQLKNIPTCKSLYDKDPN